MKVRFVDGEKVRQSQKTPVFIGGGHGHVYGWIPKDEIWLERMLNKRAHRFNFAHEIIEVILMKELRFSYEKAHGIANRLEGELRHGAPVKRTFARYLKRYLPRGRHERTLSSIAAVFRKLA